MLKKLNGLVLAALLAANAPVMAAGQNDAALAQVAAQVKALVAEGEKTGLSQEEIVAVVSQAIETNALSGVAALTAKQKKYVRYFVYGILAALGIYGCYCVYGWYKATPAADTAAPDASAADTAAPDASAAGTADPEVDTAYTDPRAARFAKLVAALINAERAAAQAAQEDAAAQAAQAACAHAQ